VSHPVQPVVHLVLHDVAGHASFQAHFIADVTNGTARLERSGQQGVLDSSKDQRVPSIRIQRFYEKVQSREMVAA